ncbi:DUF4145 domain-containing protein [Pseudomonas sp. A-B-19]|uniref:DUF4145 domain-containing protein n=1 Tax=Pseudomonas sp. A-B-19 TaxID=2832405 RepID=UPI001CBF1340|nr:DUF4145 domain-containing protein [Pseudomonas sp. A-B-19]
MDKNYFQTYFDLRDIPAYGCPVCNKGMLVKESHLADSTAATKRATDQGCREGWWEPEYEESIFRVDFKCSHCDELVFAIGDGFIEQEHDVDGNGNWERYWVNYYRPKHFWPSLKFIDCPLATPSEVKRHIEASSALYYSHPAASCNSMRMAAEEVLNALGVERSTKENYISLGNRIKLLPEESSEYALLDAIRWLGNDGSHSDSIINHTDVESAFSIMELLVDELYSDRKHKVKEMAARIREHRGPVRR